MTIKPFSILLVITLLSITARCQMAFQKYYFSSPTDVRAQIFETVDSSLFIARQTIINGTGHFQLIKANQNGDTIWCKSNYDAFINQYFNVSPAADGNFFIGGVNADTNSDMRGVILKMDTAGNVLWSKIFSDTLVNFVTIVHQMNNGDLLIGGMLIDYPYRWNTEGVVLKLDSAGNYIWNLHVFNTLYAENLIEEADGGFIIRGKFNSFYPDYEIARFDQAGNLIWHQSQHGVKNGSPLYYGADSLLNSVGSDQLLRIDSTGAIVSSINFNFGDEINSITRTSDFGYVVSSVINVSFTESKAVFYKLDSLFQPVWQKTIQNYSMESPVTCFQARSGRYFFMTNVDSYQHQVRGFSLTGFDTTSLINSAIITHDHELICNKFYPNPFSNYSRMDLSEDMSNTTIFFYDVFGRQKRIIHSNNKSVVLDKKDFSSGIYFYQIFDKGETLCTGRVVVE